VPKIASVPYAPGLSYDFYDDKLVIGSDEIAYSDIDGYGFLLTHRTQSVYFVPVANSTKFTILLDLGDKGIYKFGSNSAGVSAFRTDKQKTMDTVYSETVKCTDALIAPIVIEKMFNTLKEGGEVTVGRLTIRPNQLIKKTTFSTKELPLSKYSAYKFAQGRVNLYQNDKKGAFHSDLLSTINAPLLPTFLGYLLKMQSG
jgi:hypothetical protein